MHFQSYKLSFMSGPFIPWLSRMVVMPAFIVSVLPSSILMPEEATPISLIPALTTITNPLTFLYVIKVKLVSVRWSIITQVYNKLPDYCS